MAMLTSKIAAHSGETREHCQEDMMDPVEQKDPAQENRRLRAAMEQMRSRQNVARGGVAIAIVLFFVGRQFRGVLPPGTVDALQTALALFGLVVIALAALPFLRSICPKCRQRYHSPASLFRSADDPAPCKHCGFQINKHVSRYS